MAHFELYILGLLGIVIHYLKGWAEANKAEKQYDLRKSLPTISLTMITVDKGVFAAPAKKPAIPTTTNAPTGGECQATSWPKTSPAKPPRAAPIPVSGTASQ